MRHRSTTLFTTALLGCSCAFGQTPADTGHVVGLPAVVLTAERGEAFQAGLNSKTLDSLVLRQYAGLGLKDLLADQTGIYVKTYGSGGIALPTFRGTSANHTGLVWNGIVVNVPTLGQADLALVPASILGQHVRIQAGGASALYGSGLIGGSIQLAAQPVVRPLEASVQLTGGSFGLRAVRAELGLRPHAQWWSNTRLAVQQADNNFWFINKRQLGHPRQQQQHSQVRQVSGLQDVGWQSATGVWQASIHAWLSGSTRELSATLADTRPGREMLEDASARLLVQVQRVGQRASFRLRTAYLNDWLRYASNPGVAPNSDTRSETWVYEAEWRQRLTPLVTLLTGLHHTNSRARTDGYGPAHVYQARYAGFTSLAYHSPNNRLQTDLTLRQEWTPNWGAAPFTPALGAKLRVWEGAWPVHLRLHGSRVYRLPTLNERFWRGSGNPDIRAEQGWTAEAGPSVSHRLGNTTLQANLTGYLTDLADWILWLPTTSGGTRARNQPRVRVSGLESDLTAVIPAGRLRLEPALTYSYTRSRILASEQRDELGKQLLYVPYHQGNARLRVAAARWWLQYSQAYTGARYDNNLNTAALPSYTLGTAATGTHVNWGGYRVALLAQVRNVWDTAYNPVPSYPAPGREYQLSLSCTY